MAVQTNSPDFDGTEFEVRRRYSDFVWLQSELEKTLKHVKLPKGYHCPSSLSCSFIASSLLILNGEQV